MQTLFDRIAITLSGICVIHCIAFPIFASLIPLFATTLHHGHSMHEFWFHHFILIFILPFSLFAMIVGYKRHKQLLPIVIASIGLTVLVLSALFAGALITNQIIPHDGETYLTVFGGIIHAVGHFMNLTATGTQRLACANH